MMVSQVINGVKMHYRKISCVKPSEQTFKKVMKEINIKHAIILLTKAWEQISQGV